MHGIQHSTTQNKATQHNTQQNDEIICSISNEHVCVDVNTPLSMNVFIVCVSCLFSSLHTMCTSNTFSFVSFRYLFVIHIAICHGVCVYESIHRYSSREWYIIFFRGNDKTSTPKQLLYESQLLWFLYTATPIYVRMEIRTILKRIDCNDRNFS